MPVPQDRIAELEKTLKLAWLTLHRISKWAEPFTLEEAEAAKMATVIGRVLSGTNVAQLQ